MAEWFVGPVMEKIIDTCFEYLKDQVRWQTGMKEELEKLRDIRPQIQAVVSAYSQVEIKDPDLNTWLWKLRDAVDEADDVLDECEYRKREKQVLIKHKKIRKVRSLMKSLKRSSVKIFKRALKIDPNLKRLEEAVQKLYKISAEVRNFLRLLDSAKQEQQQLLLEVHKKRETGSMPTNNLLGRSKEMEVVRQWLRNPYQKEMTNTDLYGNISLLSVVGHGGMGKTTLLQHVYEDGVTNEFDLKIWICVSNNFDAKTVIKNMLESLKKESTSLDSLESLQRTLQSEVMSKRFLLVLDDIWEADEMKWMNVLTPLRCGGPESKILITTRLDSVASMFANMIKKSKETLQLKGLEEDEFLQLFTTHAFAGVENPDDHKRLRFIAREMVKKLLGCPLAAKVIGGILNFNLDERYWTKVLNSNIGNVEPGQNDLLPILKLSYIYLPNFLQNCFAFCCVFPQDHEFDKDDLVRMWIALGFIQSSNTQGETIEDIGRKYFNILVQKSFFDEFQKNNGVYYKMHDVLHELAQFVSTEECLLVEDDKELSIFPETIRHLSINTNRLNVFEEMREFKNLRSLFLSYHERHGGIWHDDENFNENFDDLLSKILKAFKTIRLLVISAPNLKRIPETFSCLIHLRYLKVKTLRDNNRCYLFKFPRSISNLYHMQFIIHEMSSTIVHFDSYSKMKYHLFNGVYEALRFDAYDTIHEIGKLTSLQELNCFTVQNEVGYGIGELEHMNELRRITIHQLENTKDVEEARSAKLYDKKNLTDLSLRWGGHNANRKDIVDRDLDEKILDCFQPCKNIKRLEINEYMGVRSAMWMTDISAISNLEHIELNGCSKWQTLPPFGQLPFLKFMYLYNMPEVEKLDHNKDCMFPSLEVLHILHLNALQEWFETTPAAENGCLLPCLTDLLLSNCPKLQALPSLPPKLQKLRLFNIDWKGCNWLEGIRNSSSIDLVDFSNQTSLSLQNHLRLMGLENS